MKKIYFLIIIVISIFVFSANIYAYKIGDVVTYNDIDFYVIKDSDSDSDNVTLLKADPLTVEEVNLYGGVGTDNNHVNMYVASSNDSYYHQAYNSSGYGGMAYYSSVNCGFGQDSNYTHSGCTANYADSEVKYVVDAWKTVQAPQATEARLITYAELTDLGEILQNETPSGTYDYIQLQYDWAYNENYWYWTMTQYQDPASIVWYVENNGILRNYGRVNGYSGSVRPVITISKSAIEVEEKSADTTNKDVVNDSKEVSKKNINNTVRVPNTLKNLSGLIILIGLVFNCVGLNVFIIIKNKDRNNK